MMVGVANVSLGFSMPPNGKAAGKDQEVVAFPGVFAVQVFGGHQHVLHLGEFELCGVDQVRRRVHSGVRTDLAEFHVSHRQGQEVGRDGLVHAERVDAVVRFGGGVHSAHQRHQLLGDPNGRVVREPDAGAVLAGHPCSGQNGLALREQEGALTLNPQEGVCLVGRAVGHSHLFRCWRDGNAQGLPDEGALWSELKLDLLSIHGHGLDVQSSAVQQHALRVVGHVELVGGRGVNLT